MTIVLNLSAQQMAFYLSHQIQVDFFTIAYLSQFRKHELVIGIILIVHPL